jgi:hypothetical protein
MGTRAQVILAATAVLAIGAAVWVMGEDGRAARGRSDEPAQSAAPPPRPAAEEYAISEAITHENLAVYMVYSPDKIKGEFLTLKEAMDGKVIIVHETGEVGELAVENTGEKTIYIQSGEIVKGGRQDRTLQWDMILPVKSGKVPIQSFCVEHGRWSQRGSEDSAKFGSSEKMLATRELKLAARGKGDQGEVWKEVARAQDKLSGSVGKDVRSDKSDSSLQLTLENADVQKKVAEYVAKLVKSPEGGRNAVGFAFAINGEINSVDVYGSGGLFTKLWPKLLEAAATEAIAKVEKDKKFTAPTASDVLAMMDQVRKEKAQKETAMIKGGKDRMRITDGAAAARYETRGGDGNSVHDSYIKK